jgi:hypothetical protein
MHCSWSASSLPFIAEADATLRESTPKGGSRATARVYFINTNNTINSYLGYSYM